MGEESPLPALGLPRGATNGTPSPKYFSSLAFVVGAALVVGFAVATAGCGATTVSEHTVTVTEPGGATVAGSSPVIPQPRPQPAGVGIPVRDGPLEFTVHGVRRASSVPTPAGTHLAQGEYLIVSLTVANVGAKPTQYYTDSQSLVIGGRQNPADVLAAVYLDPQSTEYITPGLAIDIETPFDVPAGSVPESIVLSDIGEPGGVVVNLAGVHIS